MGNKKWDGITNQNKATILEYQDFRQNVQKKSIATVYIESRTLRKLAQYFGEIAFKNLSEKQLQNFFADSTQVTSNTSRDLYATHIIKFYRRLLGLKRKERPAIMDWFEYQTSAQKDREKDPNAKEKYFLLREEYEKLIRFTPDLQEKALWETMYLSGARPKEACSMQIDSLRELDNGYEITVYDSKTKPRNIPLVEHPEHLLRWIRNHPFRDDDHPLWLSMSRRNLNNPMTVFAMEYKLRKATQRSDIKSTITPHCFRKTRATLMFPEYTDKEMSLHFGWKLKSVPLRREEYDLTDQEDLRRKVFGNGIKAQSYDSLKEQKELLENQHQTELDSMKKKISDLENQLQVNLEDMITYIKSPEFWASLEKPLPDYLKKKLQKS